ncbi:sarcosine oxidase subunit gamma [Nocardia terpenica]|uniref:Sarcosine oxidase subunit gamma n=1 Tax=Nocardia terpenica TaxID=455432 RepID=A0A291RL03_9NOCA|nr:sarcosine oxidase subunit gamma family protein [Nocardia terpenica]ATL67782.1 sarcosine oxidase subunit gamma [Nocardia terpenica]
MADTVTISAEPFAAMVNLWADPAGPGGAAAGRVLGLELPTAPSTFAEAAPTCAIWLGPEEWLVTDRTAAATVLEARLRAAVGGHGGAAVDVSGQRTAVRLGGSRARDLLAKGCSIDLHPRVFRAGSAVQTMLGRAAVILSALDDAGTDYRILVRSSFAGHLARWLTDAAAELG